VKLGGINMIPEPTTVSVLTDPLNPTIVMGEYSEVVMTLNRPLTGT
jgi:hypothetical protein